MPELLRVGPCDDVPVPVRDRDMVRLPVDDRDGVPEPVRVDDCVVVDATDGVGDGEGVGEEDGESVCDGERDVDSDGVCESERVWVPVADRVVRCVPDCDGVLVTVEDRVEDGVNVLEGVTVRVGVAVPERVSDGVRVVEPDAAWDAVPVDEGVTLGVRDVVCVTEGVCVAEGVRDWVRLGVRDAVAVPEGLRLCVTVGDCVRVGLVLAVPPTQPASFAKPSSATPYSRDVKRNLEGRAGSGSSAQFSCPTKAMPAAALQPVDTLAGVQADCMNRPAPAQSSGCGWTHERLTRK